MATEIKMPQFGVSMESGTIAAWLKSVGDEIKAGEAIASIETEKLTNDVICEVDGVVLALVAQEGDDVPVQGLMAVVGVPGESWNGSAPTAPTEKEPSPAAVPSAAAEVSAAPAADGRVKASPYARRVAADLHIDLAQVIPSHKNGRIKAGDVYAYQKAEKTEKKVEATAVTAAPASAFPVKNLELMEGDVTERLSGMRKVVAQRMYTSCMEIPPVTQTIKVDVTALMAFRKKLNAQRETKLSVNDFVLKATAKALRACPWMLVSLDGETLIRRAHVNLGMAVALDAGLIVPVIHDADTMGLQALSDKAKSLAARARDGQLTTDEYKGSTFTVSNLGMFGVETFTPIINQPDAAILGVNCISDELALAEDGSVCKHQVMRVSLTYDHRLLDGSQAAKFELYLRDLLENPMEIVL